MGYVAMVLAILFLFAAIRSVTLDNQWIRLAHTLNHSSRDKPRDVFATLDLLKRAAERKFISLDFADLPVCNEPGFDPDTDRVAYIIMPDKKTVQVVIPDDLNEDAPYGVSYLTLGHYE